MSSNSIDFTEYRRALGCFATGVAVITTVDVAGNAVGITVNSFNSVSLDPPLVLWSVAEDAGSYETFVNARHFAVNVLSVNQQDVCERFAKSGTDKFDGLDYRKVIEDVPVLPQYSAVFVCETENVFDGGDHKIIVGRVLEFEDRKTDPLIFYRGHYLT